MMQQHQEQQQQHSKSFSADSSSSSSKRPPPGVGSSSVYPVPTPIATYERMPPYKHRVSWLVPLFVLANVVLFIVTMFINNCPKHSTDCRLTFLKRLSFQPFSENPLLGPSADTLKKMGGLDWASVVKHNQGWRLISCIWLHAGVFHLLVNMLCLLFIGIRLEKEFGAFRIGALYLLSGFGGSILSALFIQDRISVGASGALFGLLGGMLSELITNWSIYSNKCAALVTLVIIIVVNLALGILPHVDNFAHIGGFASGFLLGFVLLVRPQLGWTAEYADALPGGAARPVKSKHKVYQYVFGIVALLLLIAGYTAGLVLLFRGVDANDKCHWCHYLSCVPTSRWKCNSGGPVMCHYSYDKGYLTVTCDGSSRSRDWPNIPDAGNDNEYCKLSCS